VNQQRSLALALILFCGIAAGLAWGLARRGGIEAGTTLSLPAATCQRAPKFGLGYQREPNGVEPFSTGGWSFQGQAYMQTDVCGPGTLKITADGEAALGVLPELQISLNSVPLKTIKVGRSQEFSVVIPEAGHLTLGYFNDYFKADVRVAIIRRVTATGCATPPRLELLGTSGGTVDTALSLATLYSTRIIRINSCPTGRVGLRLEGRAGGGAFPVVRFKSGGKNVLQVQTADSEQKVTSPVTGSLDMELLNPYAKLIGDRNLNIRRVGFSQVR
jgi:hypothetical protein